MNKIILSLFLIYVSTMIFSQDDSLLYGVVRKNYYSLQTDPFDPSFEYEVFDSATVKLGKLNPNTGFVENISETGSSMAVNLTGAALNPYTNSYLFFGGFKFITMDMNTGTTSQEVTLFNQNGESYFDNFRFNNSDSTIYGLARRNFYDAEQNFTTAEMFLAKLNSETGEIQQVSQNSIGQGFAYTGSAIDPFQMVYYFSKGDEIVGLDMYSGEIYSSFPIDFAQGKMFDNFTYSCADTALYGLIRQNFYTTVFDSLNPGWGTQTLDSTSIKLGRIKTNTGIIEEISVTSLEAGGYSINASSAIDPNTMTYYFSTGNNIIGVSMVTGEMIHNNPLNFEDGSFFDLMRSFNNCINATKSRTNAETASTLEDNENPTSIFPNPASTEITIAFSNPVQGAEIRCINQVGLTVACHTNFSGNSLRMPCDHLAPGIYYLLIQSSDNNEIKCEKLIISK
jgi:hypothetical protein